MAYGRPLFLGPGRGPGPGLQSPTPIEFRKAVALAEAFGDVFWACRYPWDPCILMYSHVFACIVMYRDVS